MPTCACGCGEPVAKRFKRGHDGKIRLRDSFELDPATGCWVWQRKVCARSGYGRLQLRGSRKWVAAHRFIYELCRGPIEEGMQLDHLCRNRACVNPEHVEPVTAAENIHRGNLTKLTAAQALEAFTSSRSNKELAEKFGVHASTIQSVRAGKSWRSVTGIKEAA